MSSQVSQLRAVRPKVSERYDRLNIERTFQAQDLELEQKYDRRADLILPRGKNLIVSNDNGSGQYGIGVNASGLLRVIDYATGNEGTFSVSWDQVDGAAEQITTLTSYVDTQDAALQSSITTNALSITNNTSTIAAVSTSLTSTQSDVSGLQGTATSLTARMTAVDGGTSASSTIDQLEARLTTNEADILTRATNTRVDTVESDAASALSASEATQEAAWQADDTAASAATATAYTAAIATETAARGVAIDAVEAKIQSPGLNILEDPQNLSDTWTISANHTVIDDPIRGRCFHIDSSTTSVSQTALHLPTNAGGKTFTWSYEAEWVSGTFYVDVVWYNSSGVSVLDGAQSVTNSAQDFTVRKTVTATVPATAERFRLRIVSTGAGTEGYIRRIQLEEGSEATPFSDDGGFVEVGATSSILKDAFVDSATGEAYARIREEVAATGSDPALMTLESADGTSKYGLVATIIRLFNNVGSTTIEVMRAVGGYVFFSNPISIDKGGYRTTLGPNDDVVLWFGADTVDPPDQTVANSKFALADDGEVYLGGSVFGDLTGAKIDAYPSYVGSANPSITNSVTATAIGGDGAFTYAWSILSGDTVTIDSPTSASSTFRTAGTGASSVVRCTITETASGDIAYVDAPLTIVYIAPP